MTNQSKKDDQRYWDKWKKSGAIGDAYGNRVNGEAHAFFNCNASPTEIVGEMPTIRRLVKTPNKLELYLSEGQLPMVGVRSFFDTELHNLETESNEIGRRYILTAKSPVNMTNRETAEELSAILNQAYQSPLYKKDEPFVGDIAYKDRIGYVFL